MNNNIVSFTSYPARIKNLKRVVDSIRNQTVMPDKLILYLARVQFRNEKLPEEIEELIDDWFEVRWTDEDLLSHKKYYYAFRDFPNDNIITIDDDIVYNKGMVEELLRGSERFPNCIIARRAYIMTWQQNNEVESYEDWYYVMFRYQNEPRMDLFATSGGGTLFPPHCFGKEVLNKETFMYGCRYADDVWLKTMSLLYKIPTVLVRPLWYEKLIMNDLMDVSLYEQYNKGTGNDQQLRFLLFRYGIDLYKECHTHDSLTKDVGSKYMKEDYVRLVDCMIEKASSRNNIYLYGAGKVGQKILKCLIDSNKDDRIRGFVESEDIRVNEEILGKKIYDLKYIINHDKNSSFIISASSKFESEIVNKLIESGVHSSCIITFDDVDLGEC